MPSPQEEIASQGAVPLLIDLLKPESSPTSRESAAQALSNLACHSANQEEVVRCGAVPVLMQAMTQSSAACQEACAR